MEPNMKPDGMHLVGSQFVLLQPSGGHIGHMSGFSGTCGNRSVPGYPARFTTTA